MLQITVPDTEYFDEELERFFTVRGRTLDLEHSLISLSKWESKWKVPFLGPSDKTTEQTLDYIRCMTLGRDLEPLIYQALTDKHIAEVAEYISADMTATTFREEPGRRGATEIITSELIYYWMIAMNIPFECQKWHLNRLLTLIRVCGIKNSPPKKMSRAETLAHNRALNAARRQKLGSTG